MKKLIFIALTFAFLIQNLQLMAQRKKAYMRLNVGYGFGTATANVNAFQNITELSNDVLQTENVNFSLGKGAYIGLGFGLKFNKYLAAELGLTYLSGGKSTATLKSFDGFSRDISLSANMLQINPSVVLTTGGFLKVVPYARLGLIVGVGNIEEYDLIKFQGNSANFTKKYTGGTALGFNAGLGLSYPLTANFSLFNELSLINMSYAPTEGKITSAFENNNPILKNLEVAEREFIYADIVTGGNTSQDPNKPTVSNKELFPMSSIMLNFGIRANF